MRKDVSVGKIFILKREHLSCFPITKKGAENSSPVEKIYKFLFLFFPILSRRGPQIHNSHFRIESKIYCLKWNIIVGKENCWTFIRYFVFVLRLNRFFPALLPFFLLFQRSFCSFLSSWSNQVFLFEQMSISSNEQEETIYKTDKYKFRKAKNDQKKF